MINYLSRYKSLFQVLSLFYKSETEKIIQDLLINRKLEKSFGRRAAIEPVISHLKSDYRLKRNFYKGIFGDKINVMLSATAFNFKRMMNKWNAAFLAFLQNRFLQPNTYFKRRQINPGKIYKK
jgi:hypothetical protein